MNVYVRRPILKFTQPPTKSRTDLTRLPAKNVVPILATSDTKNVEEEFFAKQQYD